MNCCADSSMLARRIESILVDFVKIPSITGTKDERLVEDFYQGWFNYVDYFKEHRDQSGFFKIPGDHLERTIPWCLLKGNGDDTVVLLHHYDVVDVGDYKELQNLATEPYALKKAFRDGKRNVGNDAMLDLDDDNWIFGRGVADMKGGAAIQLALLEMYVKERNFKGNIILIGVPDEENLSAGGRAAPLILKQLKEKYKLNYILTLNAEPTDRVRGKPLPKIHVGSIGKVMPLIYARGTLAHAGMVYEGLNPIRLIAEVVCQLDLDVQLIDQVDSISSPAPTFLYLKDRKYIYDVSLPPSASGYMSITFLSRSIDEIMEIVRQKCVKAFDKAIEGARKSYISYMNTTGNEPLERPWRTNVKMYSDIYNEALRDSGKKFTVDLAEITSKLKKKIAAGEIGFTEASHIIIERTLLHVNDNSPVIVIALTPPYYPMVTNAMLGDGAKDVEKICSTVIKYAKERFGLEYMKYYIIGMSDLSYFLQCTNKENNDYIKNNMLLWGDIYSIPFHEMDGISMPVLNIGPWGKDVHKYTERVNVKDLCYNVPQLISLAIEEALR